MSQMTTDTPTADLAAEIERDAASHMPSDEGLRTVAALAERMQRLEHEIEQAEEGVKRLKARLHQLRTGDLPDAMAEVGMREFKLADGSAVTVGPFVSASVSYENPERAKALAWIVEQGDGAIIKHTVSVPFGRDADEDVQRLKEVLRAAGFDERIAETETVHASTLKAYIKDKVAQGVPVPLDLFKAFVGQAAKITPPKPK